MSNWTSSYIKLKGKMFFFTRTSEDKPPILLLHGYADNGLCWTRTAQAFEKEYSVIMLDFRNHGKSFVSPKGIDSYEMMQETAEFIKALNLETPWILGHSMGARIASLLTKEHPSLVKGLILEEPAFNFNPTLNIRELIIYFAFNMMIKSNRTKSIEEIIERNKKSSPSWDTIDHETWAEAQYQFAKLKQKPSLKGLRRDRVLYSEVLPFIEVPILMMVAEKGIIPKKYFQSLKDGFQEGEWVLYQMTGHNIHREQFDSFINTVRNFIQS